MGDLCLRGEVRCAVVVVMSNHSKPATIELWVIGCLIMMLLQGGGGRNPSDLHSFMLIRTFMICYCWVMKLLYLSVSQGEGREPFVGNGCIFNSKYDLFLFGLREIFFCT